MVVVLGFGKRVLVCQLFREACFGPIFSGLRVKYPRFSTNSSLDLEMCGLGFVNLLSGFVKKVKVPAKSA